MTTAPLATASGPFVKTDALPLYASAVAGILGEEALEHTRTAAEAALNLLTNPDSEAMTLRQVCSLARVDPYVPLVESLPTAFIGWTQNESAATLIPVTGGWIVDRALESVQQAAVLLEEAADLRVTGQALQLSYDTGFPHWLTVEELAAAIGVDAVVLSSTPSQIRNRPGLPAGPITSGLILKLLEDRTFGMLDHEARKAANEARQTLWFIAADSFMAAGEEVPELIVQVRSSPENLDSALRKFRSANPDPTDLDGAVELAVRLVNEAGQAKKTGELIAADRRATRVRTTRPPAKRRVGANPRR